LRSSAIAALRQIAALGQIAGECRKHEDVSATTSRSLANVGKKLRQSSH